jgi:ATP-dependent Clp protease ATP-binding subunit ClpX
MSKQYIHFNDAQSAQEFAKQNPGTVVVRNDAGLGYKIKTTQGDYSKTNVGRLHKGAPSNILDYLNLHVISQDDAKQEIALAMYYHHLKIQKSSHKQIKNNGPLMLIGPTGTGKTFIVQKACEFMNILYVHVDSASMVPEGIVGYCMSDLMADILRQSDYDTNKAEHCVIFFDEVDKLFVSDKASEYGQKIANQMLRMIEGEKLKLSAPKKVGNEVYTELDTSNMQFIFGGAFQWILDDRDVSAPTMGFIPNKINIKTGLSIEELYDSGVAKEFLGRLSSVVNLKALSADDIFNIVTKSASSPLKKYVEKIEMHGCSVLISETTLHHIASATSNHSLGVRAIDFILKRIFKQALFDAPNVQGKEFEIVFEK